MGNPRDNYGQFGEIVNMGDNSGESCDFLGHFKGISVNLRDIVKIEGHLGTFGSFLGKWRIISETLGKA